MSSVYNAGTVGEQSCFVPVCCWLDLFNELHNVLVVQHVILAHLQGEEAGKEGRGKRLPCSVHACAGPQDRAGAWACARHTWHWRHRLVTSSTAKACCCAALKQIQQRTFCGRCFTDEPQTSAYFSCLAIDLCSLQVPKECGAGAVIRLGKS